MTAIETMRLIRMFLDDSRDWFATTAEVGNIVNDAQMRKIHEYYIKMDERALRPLHRTTTDLSDGDQIVSATRPLLYPRACRMNKSGEDDPYSVLARYVDPARFYNYTSPGMLPTDTFPRTAYYTITKEYNSGNAALETYIHLSDTDAVADLLWIVDPTPFNYDDTTPGNNVSLSVSDEYHHEIAILAAEMVNIIDVGEMERGMAAYQNQRLTIDKMDEG